MNFLDPRQWLLALAFIAAMFGGIQFWKHRLTVAGYEKGYTTAMNEVRVANAKLVDDTIAKTAALQDKHDKILQEKVDELQIMQSSNRKLVISLRQRPERPASTSNVPKVASDGAAARGCTGADLYRADGELLAGIASRADTIRIELRKCYAQYNAAKEAIEEVNKRNLATSQ